MGSNYESNMVTVGYRELLQSLSHRSTKSNFLPLKIALKPFNHMPHNNYHNMEEKFIYVYCDTTFVEIG